MNWANLGALGIGGALLTVPIILHFLMQPKPVNIEFPALRFLKQRQKTTRSKMRLKHFLLLLMRCLLIAVVAIALAGPSVASADFGNWISLGGVGFSGLIVGAIALLAYIQAKKNWVLIGILAALFFGHLVYGGIATSRLLNSESADLIGDDQAPVAALLVIDTSPRMELQFENKTRLEKAQEISQWLVSQFPVESQVCIAFTDGSPPFFSVDVGAAGRRIDSLKSNYSGTRLPTTIYEGLKILEESPLERKEVYVVSDLTSVSWVGENASRLAKRLERDSEYSLFVIDVGVPLPQNFSLDSIKLSAPEMSSGGDLTLDTKIQRLGASAPCTVKLTLEKIETNRPVVRDGETKFPEQVIAQQTLNKELDSDGSANVRFLLNDQLPVGTYHGKIELEASDGLGVDDRRYFSFRVSPSHEALVVHANNVDPRLMQYLLAPSVLSEAGTARYRAKVMAQSIFMNDESIELSDYDAVFILDPGPVDDGVWSRLESFVTAGGGVGVFLGHNATDNAFADPSFTTEAAQRVLGGELDSIWVTPNKDELFVSPKEVSHPIFRPIVGFETTMLWHRFPVFRHWGIQVDAENEKLPTQTVLRYGNREPAVVERTIGLGRVLTMTTPITEYSNNEKRKIWNRLFAGKSVPGFLLVQGMADYLVQTDAESLNVQVGESAAFVNDLREFPETYQAFTPIADKAPTTLNSVDGRIRFRFNDTPGHYRLRGIFDQRVVLRGFSSNLSPAATDLTRLPPEKLDQFLGAGRYELATQQSEIQRQQGNNRRGQEFYPLIVVMMLVIMGVEFLMSNRFYS